VLSHPVIRFSLLLDGKVYYLVIRSADHILSITITSPVHTDCTIVKMVEATVRKVTNITIVRMVVNTDFIITDSCPVDMDHWSNLDYHSILVVGLHLHTNHQVARHTSHQVDLDHKDQNA